MAEYKIIFKADLKTEGNNALTWEPGCPALVTAIQVSRNTETSATYLQVKVRNVSDAAISSIFAGLEVSLPDGSVDRVPLEYLDVDLPAGAEAALKPMSLSHSDISSCALAISRIDQASSKWQTSAPAQPLPERETLPYLSSRAIDQRARALNAKADDDILRGAVQDHGDWWVCACGQVNVSRDTCCDCKQSKALLLANEDEAKLLADADAFDEQTYNEAVKLQGKGTLKALKQAAAKFDSLGQYNDAAIRCQDCRSRTAKVNKRNLKIGIASAVVAAFAIGTLIVVTQVVIPALEKAAAEAPYIQKATSSNKEDFAGLAVGDTVLLGTYEQDGNEFNGKEVIEWTVCSVEDGKALLLSKASLDYQQFNSEESSEYEKSSLKTWLEQDFKTSAFSTEQIDALEITPRILSEDECIQWRDIVKGEFTGPTSYAESKSDGMASSYFWTSSKYSVSERIKLWKGNSVSSAMATDFHYVRPAISINLDISND
jgi:hypothetical protein